MRDTGLVTRYDLTVGTTGHADGDVIGGAIALNPPIGSLLINRLAIVDALGNIASVRCSIFSGTPTPAVLDDAALSGLTAAHWSDQWIGDIDIDTFISTGTPKRGEEQDVNLLVPSDAATLYIMNNSGGTITFTNAADLALAINWLRQRA